MKISKITVRIGTSEQVLYDLDDGNPDVATLLRKAKTSSAILVIDVPATSDTASALGRLAFTSRDRDPDLDRLIPVLSKRISEVSLTARAVTYLMREDLEYVWQMAEKREFVHMSRKSKSFADVRDVLRKFGIELGIDLSSIKDRLPKPKEKSS